LRRVELTGPAPRSSSERAFNGVRRSNGLRRCRPFLSSRVAIGLGGDQCRSDLLTRFDPLVDPDESYRGTENTLVTILP
jgi:hypothetical protein